MDDPDKAADDFVRFVPEWTGKEGAVKAAFNYYVKLVYPGQKQLGEVNAERLAKLQDFYLAKGLIQRKSPLDDLYTNALSSSNEYALLRRHPWPVCATLPSW